MSRLKTLLNFTSGRTVTESNSRAKLPETAFYKHYSEIDLKNWPWGHFLPDELACKGSGEIIIDFDAVERLNRFRDIIGVPFSPNSAYRSERHNKAVGGSPNSMHRQGKAFDIPIKGKMTREVIHKVAREVGFKGIGDYQNFCHIDTGNSRYWDLRK